MPSPQAPAGLGTPPPARTVGGGARYGSQAHARSLPQPRSGRRRPLREQRGKAGGRVRGCLGSEGTAEVGAAGFGRPRPPRRGRSHGHAPDGPHPCEVGCGACLRSRRNFVLCPPACPTLACDARPTASVPRGPDRTARPRLEHTRSLRRQAKLPSVFLNAHPALRVQDYGTAQNHEGLCRRFLTVAWGESVREVLRRRGALAASSGGRR